MDYEKREREFYQTIEETKIEIERLDIPEKDRTVLYELIHGITQRYRNNMETFQKGIIDAEASARRVWGLSQTLQNISEKSKEVLNQLEGVVGVFEQVQSKKSLN